jgi:hypothetical protein
MTVPGSRAADHKDLEAAGLVGLQQAMILRELPHKSMLSDKNTLIPCTKEEEAIMLK